MLSTLPIARSPAVRRFFVATTLVTVGFMAWVTLLRNSNDTHGLSLVFMRLFLFEDHDALIVTLLLLIVLMLLPMRPDVRRVATWLAEHPWIMCSVTVAALCAGSVFVYHMQPLSMDEYAPVFQSQAFATGHLTGHFPSPVMNWLIPPGFQDTFLRVSPATGAVISGYWPSFALLLTPFTWLGIPWACNPVLSGLTLITLRKIALELFDSTEAAGLVMLLTLASPVFFADGVSYYSMTAHMLFNSVFVLLLLSPTPRRLVVAGVVGSIALSLHNPLPHTLFALPWVFWLARRSPGVRNIAWLALGYLPLTLLLLVGWFWFGNALMHQGGVPANLNADQVNGVKAAIAWPTATVVLARFIGLAKVWIWAVPGLLLLAASGARTWRDDPRCMLLAASAAVTFVAYFFFVPDQGHGWGFRYFHSAWMALPLLAAGALTPRTASSEHGASEGDGALTSFVILASLLMLVVGVGVRAVQIDSYMRDHLAQLPAYGGQEPRVVLVDPRTTVYGGDLVQNDPFLRGNATRMLLLNPEAVPAAVQFLHPDFHRVYADQHGEVWSAAKPAP